MCRNRKSLVVKRPNITISLLGRYSSSQFIVICYNPVQAMQKLCDLSSLAYSSCVVVNVLVIHLRIKFLAVFAVTAHLRP